MQRITNQATPALVTANREDAPGAAPALSGLTAVKSWTPTDLATKHFEAGNIVRDLRQELGLGASDITALRACLSTLRVDDRGQVQLVCFASNRTLCERANGMHERTFRRRITRLSEVGLVARVCSASGKRFPLKSRNGEITGAFGIDLSPLLDRLPELEERRERLAQERAEVRSLRSRVLAERKVVLDTCPSLPAGILEWLTVELDRVLRRKVSLTALRRIANQLAEIACGPWQSSSNGSETPAPQDATEDVSEACARDSSCSGALPPEAELTVDRGQARDEGHARASNLSASNGQNVRHNEVSEHRTLRRLPAREAQRNDQHDPSWEALKVVSKLVPEQPNSTEDLLGVLHDMGCWLRIDTRRIEEVLTRFGAWPTLKLLDYIATNAQRIAAPARYVARILEKESAGVPTLLSETRQRATMARS